MAARLHHLPPCASSNHRSSGSHWLGVEAVVDPAYRCALLHVVVVVVAALVVVGAARGHGGKGPGREGGAVSCLLHFEELRLDAEEAPLDAAEDLTEADQEPDDAVVAQVGRELVGPRDSEGGVEDHGDAVGEGAAVHARGLG